MHELSLHMIFFAFHNKICIALYFIMCSCKNVCIFGGKSAKLLLLLICIFSWLNAGMIKGFELCFSHSSLFKQVCWQDVSLECCAWLTSFLSLSGVLSMSCLVLMRPQTLAFIYDSCSIKLKKKTLTLISLISRFSTHTKIH